MGDNRVVSAAWPSRASRQHYQRGEGREDRYRPWHPSLPCRCPLVHRVPSSSKIDVPSIQKGVVCCVLSCTAIFKRVYSCFLAQHWIGHPHARKKRAVPRDCIRRGGACEPSIAAVGDCAAKSLPRDSGRLESGCSLTSAPLRATVRGSLIFGV